MYQQDLAALLKWNKTHKPLGMLMLKSLFLFYFSLHLGVVLYAVVTPDNPVAILGTINLSDHVVDIFDGAVNKKTIPPAAITEELWEEASTEPTILFDREIFLKDLKVYGENSYLASLFDQCEDGWVNNCPIDELFDEDGRPGRFVVDVTRWFYPHMSMFAL